MRDADDSGRFVAERDLKIGLPWELGLHWREVTLVRGFGRLCGVLGIEPQPNASQEHASGFTRTPSVLSANRLLFGAMGRRW
jgi:hypothetical protein